jgi:aminocarboxymuconate-semialdehyde decarboxylase
MIVDVHTHFFPKAFLRALGSLEKKYGYSIREDKSGQIALYHNGNLTTRYTPSFHDIEQKLRVVEEGIDVQVLSAVQPGVSWAEPELGVALCQMINDELSRIARKYPNRFIGIASVPLQSMEKALDELDRAVLKLGMRGVLVPTNVNGEDIDSPTFFPFYEKVSALGIPILIHPFSVSGGKRLKAYRLEPILDFMFENTIALTKVILGGVLKKFPNLKFCFPHLGGTFPYLMGRILKGYGVNPEARVNIDEPLEGYLRSIYLDTAYFSQASMGCALSYFGIERFVLGTDHPFLIGETPTQAIRHIMDYPSVSQEGKSMMLEENALRLFGLVMD